MSTANMSAPTVSDIAMLNSNFAAGRPKRTTVPGSLSRVGFAAPVKNSAATPTQKPRRTTMGTAALWAKRVIGSKTRELTARGPPLLTCFIGYRSPDGLSQSEGRAVAEISGQPRRGWGGFAGAGRPGKANGPDLGVQAIRRCCVEHFGLPAAPFSFEPAASLTEEPALLLISSPVRGSR